MKGVTRFSAGVAVLIGCANCSATPPIQWDNPVQIASGRAERGPWQQNDSRYDYVDDPSVAITDDGEVLVTWVDQKRKDLFFQRYRNGAPQLQNPINVSRSPATFSWLPRIVAGRGASEDVYILWQEIIFSGGSHGGDILFSKSPDGGKRFSEPLNLSQSRGGDGKGRINRETWHNGSLDIALGQAGAIFVTWTEYEGALWFSRSTDYGASFARPKEIAGGGNAKPARAPALAVAADGTIFLAWTNGEDTGADIQVAISRDGGVSFEKPATAARTKGYSDAPKLAADKAGTLHLVFAQSSGGPFDPQEVWYTRTAGTTLEFEKPRGISNPPPGSTSSSGFPSVTIDDAGRLYVAWELFETSQRRPRGLGFAVSSDAGQSFSRPGEVPGITDASGWNGSLQGLLMKKLAVNGFGRVAIVNSTFKPDEQSRVLLITGRLEADR
jgi:hypothetical protein